MNTGRLLRSLELCQGPGNAALQRPAANALAMRLQHAPRRPSAALPGGRRGYLRAPLCVARSGRDTGVPSFTASTSEVVRQGRCLRGWSAERFPPPARWCAAAAP